MTPAVPPDEVPGAVPAQTDNRPRPEDGPQDVDQLVEAQPGDADDDYDPDRDGVA